MKQTLNHREQTFIFCLEHLQSLSLTEYLNADHFNREYVRIKARTLNPYTAALKIADSIMILKPIHDAARRN